MSTETTTAPTEIAATETPEAPTLADAIAQPSTYGRLLRVHGFAPLLGSTLLTRTAEQMWTVAIILFVLQRYHSPSIAGLSVFLLIFPGLMLSPINGALLDRYGRRRLMMLDFTVAAASLLAIVGLAIAGTLPAWLLLVILTLGSFTGTLSVAGSRSLFPLTVPNHLWDRANALDSFTFGIAMIGGPALAGLVTAWRGPEAALSAVALFYVFAALALLAVHEPHVEKALSGNVVRDAWDGLRYVVSNRTLRWLAVGISVGNISWGIITVAMPVLVFRLHGNAATVGWLLALIGVAGIPATLLAGRLRTEGHERQIMAAASVLISVTSIGLLAPSLWIVAIALAVSGFANGPFDVALFSLRQRRTHAAWFGRAFAISMSLNFAGMPLGSAFSGPIIARSLTAAIVIAIVLPLVSAVVLMVAVPAREEAQARL